MEPHVYEAWSRVKDTFHNQNPLHMAPLAAGLPPGRPPIFINAPTGVGGFNIATFGGRQALVSYQNSAVDWVGGSDPSARHTHSVPICPAIAHSPQFFRITTMTGSSSPVGCATRLDNCRETVDRVVGRPVDAIAAARLRVACSRTGNQIAKVRSPFVRTVGASQRNACPNKHGKKSRSGTQTQCMSFHSHGEVTRIGVMD
jgi:hypothetical protein